MDCFSYYSPNNSVFHEVEQNGELSRNSDDTKVASTKIKINARVSIAGLVKAAIEYTKERTKHEMDSTGNCGASSATGYKGASEAKDPYSIAVAWGYHGKAKGVKGSFLVLADWEGNEDCYWKQNEWNLKDAKMVQVDGVKIKEDIWYTMVDGEIIEVNDN